MTAEAQSLVERLRVAIKELEGRASSYFGEGNWKKVDAIADRLEALAGELAALNEQFDAAGLFTKISSDGGLTWQKWTLTERVRIAIGVCLDDDEAKQIETLEAENARLRDDIERSMATNAELATENAKLRAGEWVLDDDALLKLVREHFGGEKRNLIIAKWKDGIDIDVPTYELTAFVRAMLAAHAKEGK